jgi:N-acyl-D-aspartate/D-glutamate deacylase
MASDAFDMVISGGLVFDGLGSRPRSADVGLRGGVVAAISEAALPVGPGCERVDATGKWVTPGFIDLHTHYDAEVEVAPSLSESLRHGVTAVVLGSCSLSLAVGSPEDLADMFCRVEAIPYSVVRPLLEERKTWDTHTDYLEHLASLPLGPHVAAFAGHSAMRAHAMGIERSLERSVRPSEGELAHMERMLEEALDAGYLGASIQTLPWDKMGGSRAFRSRPLPSTFGRWSEYRRLTSILRRRGRVLEGVPNVSTRVNVLLFLLESVGLLRRPLKTTMISMMDIKASPGIFKLIGLMSRVFNKALDADVRFQALPEIFDLWADGMDLVVFEEFGAGTAALHLDDAAERAALLRFPAYRKRFERDWTNRLLPKAFHRDFNESRILDCPDASVVGRSFAEVARSRGTEASLAFLDLVAEHGTNLRWYTVMANGNEQSIREIIAHPDVLIGFSDAGAHLRQMAHYNFPLRMLRHVMKAEREGQPVMTIERAIFRLTSEIGAWLGLDAGVLAEGKRADLVVLDPAAIDDRVEEASYAAIPSFGGYERLVRRNDEAVSLVVVSGKKAVVGGEVLPAVGSERGYGGVLRATGS